MNKDELIADYFSGNLSVEAKKQFDDLMAKDADFAKDVAFQKNLKTAIKKEEQEQVKAELQAFEKTLKKPSKNYIKWLVAASIVALISIPSVLFFGKTNINNDTLFAENFEPYRNVVHPIVRGENSQDLKTKAFLAYEAGNYDKALVVFDSILNEKEDATIAFYKANILLQKNQTEKAISILSNNSNLPEVLKEKQSWYMALAYIKVNENKKAISTLKALIKNSTYKKKQAEQLLKQLSS